MTGRKTRNSSRMALALASLLAAVAFVPWLPADAAVGPGSKVLKANNLMRIVIQRDMFEREIYEDDDPLHNDILLNEPDIDGEEIANCLAGAIRLHSRGEWAEALEAYYIVIDSPVDYLYKRPGVDEDRVYIGMKEFARKQMESFPEAGKRVYRLRYDRTVMKMYKKAAAELDMDALRLIDFNYALSSYSDDAAMLAADILYEQGSLNEAFYYYNRLIKKYPNTNRPLELAYARLCKCALQIGPSTLPLLRERCKALRGAPGNNTIIVTDDDGWKIKITLRKYAANICEILEKAEPANLPAETTIDPEIFRDLELKWKVTRDLHTTTTWNATLFGERLFVDLLGSRQGIKVFDTKSGKLVNVLGYNIGGGVHFSSQIVPGSEVFPATTTRDNEHYYAIIPQNLPALNRIGQSRGERWTTRLQAFDIRTTKLRWWWEPRQRHDNDKRIETSSNFEVPGCSAEDRNFMGQAYLTSAPIRYGAYLYTGAVKTTDSGSREYYIVCFDPANGALKWRTFIGSIDCFTTGIGFRGYHQITSPVIGSRLCAANDTVFFTSNMGAVGAVNSITGDVKWVAKYKKPMSGTSNRGMVMTGPPFIWRETPPLILHNVRGTAVNNKEETISLLIVAPRDSDCLYAFDPETGKRRWERPLFENNFLPGFLVPPRTLTICGGKAIIFQGAISKEALAQYNRIMRPIGRPPGFEKIAKSQKNNEKVVSVDISTGKLIPFNVFLGGGEVIIGHPIMSGSVLFLLTEQTHGSKTIRSLIGYDAAGGNDKAVVWKDITGLCEGKKINRMFISHDRIIFVCNGAVYAYGPQDESKKLSPKGV